MAQDRFLLTINGGSSSIKFAVFSPHSFPLSAEGRGEKGEGLERIANGSIERIGLPDAVLHAGKPGQQPLRRSVQAPDHEAAAHVLHTLLDDWFQGRAILAVGHRVVHGGANLSAAQLITPTVLDELRGLVQFAPEHLPAEIRLIDILGQRLGVPQVACFDTAFHNTMPAVARLLPFPRRFENLRRYGFHGLSYTYLMEELGQLSLAEAQRRVILTHLGNGASLAAVHEGKCLDTSMGFTPAAGLVMSTRTGDLDPGVVWHLLRNEGLSVDDFYQLVNRQSGLLGVSGSSSDMRDLLAREASDGRARDAVQLFCYQARKWIGAYAAVLGGLDTLVFSAGIGENSPEVRRRICSGLEFLGIQLDEQRNAGNAPVISAATSAVTVRVIPTDEELVIARQTLSVIHIQ